MNDTIVALLSVIFGFSVVLILVVYFGEEWAHSRSNKLLRK